MMQMQPCEADMELGSDVNIDVAAAAEINNTTTAMMKRTATHNNSNNGAKTRTEIDIAHVDIMYVAMDGKLVCCACM